LQLAVVGFCTIQRAVPTIDKQGGRPCRTSGKTSAQTSAKAATKIIKEAIVSRWRFVLGVIRKRMLASYTNADRETLSPSNVKLS